MILAHVFVKGVSAKLVSGSQNCRGRLEITHVHTRTRTYTQAIEKLTDVKYYPRYLGLVEEHVEVGPIQVVVLGSQPQ